jgi:hypothetical protein
VLFVGCNYLQYLYRPDPECFGCYVLLQIQNVSDVKGFVWPHSAACYVRVEMADSYSRVG